MNELKTFLITTIPSTPAVYAALDNPQTKTILTAFVMPCVFFVLSKSIDVYLQYRREKRNK